MIINELTKLIDIHGTIKALELIDIDTIPDVNIKITCRTLLHSHEALLEYIQEYNTQKEELKATSE